MALTDNGGLSAADVAAVMGNNGNGFGFGNDGSGLFWLLVLFLFGFGNGGWGNGGYANVGGEIYPWMNQSQQINDGFRDQMINSNIQGIQNSITSGFGDVQNSLCGGFAGVNASINAAQNGIVQQMYANQIAGMNQSFANQTAMLQGFNGIQGQLAECCCANQLATCQTNNTIQNEGNMTRFADANNTRDIITNQTASTQAILDKLCQLELDGVKAQVAAEQRENANLRSELMYARGQASQTEQNAFISQGFANEVDALYNRLNSCPVPTTPVFGRTPIFTCNNNNGCGCGNNGFIN